MIHGFKALSKVRRHPLGGTSQCLDMEAYCGREGREILSTEIEIAITKMTEEILSCLKLLPQ